MLVLLSFAKSILSLDVWSSVGVASGEQTLRRRSLERGRFERAVDTAAAAVAAAVTVKTSKTEQLLQKRVARDITK